VQRQPADRVLPGHVVGRVGRLGATNPNSMTGGAAGWRRWALPCPMAWTGKRRLLGAMFRLKFDCCHRQAGLGGDFANVCLRSRGEVTEGLGMPPVGNRKVLRVWWS